MQKNAGRLKRKQSVGKVEVKDVLGCWDNRRKRKQSRTVIKRTTNCSSIHPDLYEYRETSPKKMQGCQNLELCFKN